MICRLQWRRLIGEVLPTAAREHPDWPIRRDHCFARVILDTICDRPWRQAIAAPAWRNMDEAQLVAAIAIACAIARDDADLADLNAWSLRLRGKVRAGLHHP